MAFALATIDSIAPPLGVTGWSDPDADRLAAAVSWLEQLTPQAHPIAVPLRRHWRRTRRSFQCDFNIGDGSLSDPWQQWAWQSNVIWLSDDGQQVYDPAGRLLLDHSRLADAEHSHAQAVLPSPQDSRQRQAEIAVELRNRMIDPVEGLIPIPGIDEVVPRSSKEVAKRALALFLVATRAESILSGQPLEVERMRSRCPLGFAELSTDEQSFFESDRGPADGFVWRYESLMTLQWALDMQFELPWPDEHADLTAVTRLMVDLPDESIIEQSRMRSTESLLTAAERHQQLYYAIAMSQSQGDEAPGGVDPGVVCERMIALAWILNLPDRPVDSMAGNAVANESTANAWDHTVRWVGNGMV